MRRTKKFLALDIGASSGRVVLGMFEGKKLTLDEIHRFPNIPVKVHSSIHWDVLRLFSEIKKGLTLFVKKYGNKLDGIGIDTWGLDFGLFDKDGSLLENPYHYRDKRTEGLEDDVAKIIDPYEFYRTTGMKLFSISTLCQLYSMAYRSSPLLKIADFLLMMPGIFNYFLTGEKVAEYTMFASFGLYDIGENAFATEFLEKLSIPERIMPRLIEPGTVIGNLLPEISEEVGLSKVPVIAPACHDTASAVVAIPFKNNENWAFISSGTWSAIGIEVSEPLISRQSFQHNIVNERAAAKRFIAVSNIPGLWILQECRKAWSKREKILDWPEMIKLSKSAKPCTSFIDPHNKAFVDAPNMPQAIIEFCKNTGQQVPKDKGKIIRIILKSLALEYKKTLKRIESLKKNPIEVLYIVGGGAQNSFLNQLTADATGKTVYAGPVEATAIGNIVMQAIGTGHLKSIAEAREIIRFSFEIETYYPQKVVIDSA